MARDGTVRAVRQAQEDLLRRYGGAVRRYLLGALRDSDAADELFQEFSLKLVSGAFQRADAGQGRFRSFLKTSLFHLIVDYQRRGRRRNAEHALLVDVADPSSPDDDAADQEQAFTRSWREELLAQAWAGLAEAEKTTAAPYYAVLRFRFEHPELRSPDIAAQLSQQLGKPLTANSVRVLIHLARQMFAEHVLDRVIDSLDTTSLEAAEQELIELNLLDYCREVLRQRGEKTAMDYVR